VLVMDLFSNYMCMTILLGTHTELFVHYGTSTSAGYGFIFELHVHDYPAWYEL
jgi:hypothetical protein